MANEVPKFDPNQPYEEVAEQTPTFDPSQPYEEVDNNLAPEDEPQTSTMDAALEGLKSGASLGFADEFSGLLGAGMEGVANSPQEGQSKLNQLISAYKEYRDAARKKEDLAAQEHPMAYGGGALAGGMILPLGAFSQLNAATKVGRAAQGAGIGASLGGIAGLGQTEDVTDLAQTAKDVGSGVAGGAVTGAAMMQPLAAATLGATVGGLYGYNENPEDTQEDKLSNAAIYGTGGALVAGGLSRLAQPGTIRKGLKKSASIMGPSEKAIEGYIENPDLLKNVPELPKVRAKILESVNDVKARLKSGEIDVDQADAELKVLSEQMRASEQNINLDHRQQQFEHQENVLKPLRKEISDIGEQKAQAEGVIKADRDTVDAKQKELEKIIKTDVDNQVKDLKAQTSGGVLNLQAPVADAIGALKQQVVDLNNQSLDLLSQNPNIQIDINDLKNAISGSMDKLKVQGQYRTDIAEKTGKQLESLGERLKDVNELSPQETKMLIKQLDQSTTYSNNLAEHNEYMDQALKSFRQTLDKQVKGKVEGYDPLMQEISRKVSLLEKLRDKFGTPDKINSRLNSVDKKTASETLKTIQDLDKEVGTNFSDEIGQYTKTKELSKDPRLKETLMSQHPAQQQLEQLRQLSQTKHPVQSEVERLEQLLQQRQQILEQQEMLGAQMRNPKLSEDAALKQLESTGLPAQMQEKVSQLDELKNRLQTLREEAAPYQKSELTEKGTEPFINKAKQNILEDSGAYEKEVLADLEKLTPGITKDVQKLRMSEEFGQGEMPSFKEYLASRGVAESVAPGMGDMAAYGYFATRRFGGQMVKGAIDAGRAVSNFNEMSGEQISRLVAPMIASKNKTERSLGLQLGKLATAGLEKRKAGFFALMQNPQYRQLLEKTAGINNGAMEDGRSESDTGQAR